jgi:hypothetical protein
VIVGATKEAAQVRKQGKRCFCRNSGDPDRRFMTPPL